MTKLVTFFIAAFIGGVLGVVGTLAMISAVSPSADHVANQTTVDPAQVYGTR